MVRAEGRVELGQRQQPVRRGVGLHEFRSRRVRVSSGDAHGQRPPRRERRGLGQEQRQLGALTLDLVQARFAHLQQPRRDTAGQVGDHDIQALLRVGDGEIHQRKGRDTWLVHRDHGEGGRRRDAGADITQVPDHQPDAAVAGSRLPHAGPGGVTRVHRADAEPHRRSERLRHVVPAAQLGGDQRLDDHDREADHEATAESRAEVLAEGLEPRAVHRGRRAGI